jgi:hypothetical protein
MHANRIRKVNSAQCLVDLPKLRSLTMHGNPCEQQTKNYRLIMGGMFKQIKVCVPFCVCAHLCVCVCPHAAHVPVQLPALLPISHALVPLAH